MQLSFSKIMCYVKYLLNTFDDFEKVFLVMCNSHGDWKASKHNWSEFIVLNLGLWLTS